MVEQLPRKDRVVYVCVIIMTIKRCKRAQLTVGGNITRLVVLGCIKKLTDHEPFELVGRILPYSLLQVHD